MKSGEFRDDKDGKKLSFRVKKTFKDDGPLGIPQRTGDNHYFFHAFYGGMACFFSLLYFWNSVNSPIMKSSYISESRLTLSYSLSYSAKKIQRFVYLPCGLLRGCRRDRLCLSQSICAFPKITKLSVTKVLRKLWERSFKCQLLLWFRWFKHSRISIFTYPRCSYSLNG